MTVAAKYISSDGFIDTLGLSVYGEAWTGEEVKAQAEDWMIERKKLIASRLLAELADGENTALVQNMATGESDPISAEFWHRDNAFAVLMSGMAPISWWHTEFPGNYISLITGNWVANVGLELGPLFIALPSPERPISVDSSARSWASLAKSRRAPLLNPEPPVAAVRGSGGRPRKHDWEALLLELVRLEHESGAVNKTPGELLLHLQVWCRKNGRDEPAESEIKKRIRLYRAAAGGEKAT